MKVLYTALVAYFVASSEGFTMGGKGRLTTKLNQYRPTKWTPQGGASATWGTDPATNPVSLAPSPIELPPPPPVLASPLHMDYSGVKWSPQRGSNPSWSVEAPSTDISLASPLVPVVATDATVTGDYSGVKWSPQGGSNPTWIAAAVKRDGTIATVANKAVVPDADATFAAATDSSRNYSGVKWSPQGGSNPTWNTAEATSAWTAVNNDDDSLPQPQMADPSLFTAQTVPTMEKKNYSGVKWNPRVYA